MTNIPLATYRVQLHQSFTFKDLEQILDYLCALGITHIYASPVLQAESGSMHGYDVADPHHINPEIGTQQELEKLAAWLKEKRMGWIQDIVPNHMTYSAANKRLMDVLERGALSEYYRYFDINWQHPDEHLKGRLMAPFLADSVAQSIEKGVLQLQFNTVNGFTINGFPLSVSSYALVAGLLPARSAARQQLLLLQQEGLLPAYIESWSNRKQQFLSAVESDDAIATQIQQAVTLVNQDKILLNLLLQQQHYIFTCWRETDRCINYRRFFTVNSLICLAMENDNVFTEYHRLIHSLYSKGLIQGLRIDHIDGLYDPEQYIDRLRNLFGNDCYIIAEKILSGQEVLPASWKLEGTSGYEFLAYTNQLLTNRKGAAKLSAFYHSLMPEIPAYKDLVYNSKKKMLENHMQGELDNLITLFFALNLQSPGMQQQQLAEGLKAFMCSLPAYRIYPERIPLEPEQQQVITNAFNRAYTEAPQLTDLLQQLQQLFTAEDADEALQTNRVLFIKRLMQFTGPLTAKGVEDTAFYIFNPLISHEEVGDSPAVLGETIQEFHRKMQARLQGTPHSMNATSTHDTKRGEDARMRINVLAELAEEWSHNVTGWMQLNATLRTRVHNAPAPSCNDEYFIYQSLIGGFPEDLVVTDTFRDRLKAYFIKMVREAKVNSNWADPDELYETACIAFIDRILDSQHSFISRLLPFVKKVCGYACLPSLVQALLKMTAPGIPDIYRGSELFDLAYVDPDNRTPVDYAGYKKHLEQLIELEKGPAEELLRYLHENRLTGVQKMFLIRKVLQCRRQYPDIFLQGDYIPLQLSVPGQPVIAFARHYQSSYAIVIAPLQPVLYMDANGLMKPGALNDVQVILPEEIPVRWKNECTGEVIRTNGVLALQDVIRQFPVALLTGYSNSLTEQPW